MALPLFIEPLDAGFKVTSRWNSKRLRATPPQHRAFDYGVEVGAPVYAVAAGVVVSKTYEGRNCFRGKDTIPGCKASGNMVVVYHPQFDIWTRYMHLSRFAELKTGGISKPIEVGDSVNMGTQIGYSGHTGLSDRPHLHIDFLTTPETYRNILKPLASAGQLAKGWTIYSRKAPGKDMYLPRDPEAKNVVIVGYVPAELFLNNVATIGQSLTTGLSGYLRGDAETVNEIMSEFPTPEDQAPLDPDDVDETALSDEQGDAPGGFEEEAYKNPPAVRNINKLWFPIAMLAVGVAIPVGVTIIKKRS